MEKDEEIQDIYLPIEPSKALTLTEQIKRDSENLFTAITSGNITYIKSVLFRNKKKIKEYKDNHNQNALFYAILIEDENKAIDIMEKLINLNCNPYQLNIDSESILFEATSLGKLTICKYLIELLNFKVDKSNNLGQTPIFYAAKYGFINIIEYFLFQKASINTVDNFGENCLFPAIEWEQINAVKYLIDNGININQINKDGLTPLKICVNNQNELLIELIKSKGGIIPPDKKRNNLNKSCLENIKSKKIEKVINQIQTPRRYILVNVDKNGKKNPLKDEEINNLMKDYSKVNKLLLDKEELTKEIGQHDVEILLKESWEQTAKTLIYKLTRIRDCDLFKEPIDPIKLQIPDYFHVIKRPMDFKTINKKLANFQYTNCSEFCVDVHLIFDNCIRYFGINSDAVRMMNNVKKEYLRLFKEMSLEKYI